MLLWNLGVNTVLVLYFANQNHKRIDLSKGSTFNWEGVGASQWLLTIPLLLTPFILYFPFYYFGYSDTGIVIIGAFGLISMLSREFWLNMLIKEFNKKRFIIAEGFRIR